jgi:ubiquinone/menaquinone biosynthesis C-methylase UbiE
MNCLNLQFKDQVFDLVVSFEVIEHLSNQELFLSEAKRVLKDSGTFIASTPNKSFYPQDFFSSSKESEHVRELSHLEFVQLLEDYFPSVKLYGQFYTFPFRFIHIKRRDKKALKTLQYLKRSHM